MSISITKHGDRIIAEIPEQLVGYNRMELRRKVIQELERG